MLGDLNYSVKSHISPRMCMKGFLKLYLQVIRNSPQWSWLLKIILFASAHQFVLSCDFNKIFCKPSLPKETLSEI
jgi:hypothetical protein